MSEWKHTCTCVPNVEKYTEALLVASKNTGLEVNAERTKYMLMSRGHNARKRNNTK